jgi:hypothetical protein
MAFGIFRWWLSAAGEVGWFRGWFTRFEGKEKSDDPVC